jgi:hypothetical protein
LVCPFPLQADLSGRRLGRAGKLTALLGDEMARWQATADGLAARIALLPGDTLLAAACLSYTGAFTGEELGARPASPPPTAQHAPLHSVGPPAVAPHWLSCFLPGVKGLGSARSGECLSRCTQHPIWKNPPGPYRAELLDAWLSRCAALGIPHTPGFTLAGALASPVELREWALHGLPADGVSVDNGVLVLKSGGRWPLMIDPQDQGCR